MKLKGKIIPALLLSVVLLFVGILILYTAKKSGTEVSVKYPEGYTVITKENAHSQEEYIEKLGYGTSSFIKYLENKNIVSFAGNEDNSRQLRLITKSTEFTRQLGSIAGASDKELQLIAEQLLPNGYSYIYRLGGNVYYEIDRTVTEGDVSYCTIQFITVKNGKYYALIYYGSSKEISDAEKELAESTLKTLKIPEEGGVMAVASSGGVKRIVYIVIVSIVIFAGVILIILHGVSLIRDINNRKKRSDYSDLVIKRRKK